MSTAAPIHTAVQDFLEQFRGLMRFGWVALVVAWGTAIALWIVVFSIPNTYEATARVFVDPRTTLNEATQGISLGDDMESQIERVREAITGEPQLETVAQETNLLVGALTPKAKQGVIDDLRQNLDITGMFLDPKDSGDTRGPESAVFTISYRNSDRTRSLAVVDRLLSTFVENSLGGNQQGSEQAQQFLEAQISDYGKHLTEAEQRLADFKRRNVGLMPQDQQDYFTRLQAEMTGLNQTQEALAVDIRKRDAIEKEIKGGQAFIAGSSLPMGGASGAEPTNIEQQIEQAQHQLDQLVLKFTDNYPDVIALRRTLRELKDRQKAEIVAARNGDPTAAAEIGLAANPVYQQLEVQYNQAQVDIASIQQDIADREKRIASFRAQMGAAPAAQAEYSQLTRDYDVTKTQYDALLQRLDRARLGQQAAATGT
ncbi:MAG: XrtA system polysaccharide chain length determinant, partial [Steroidobacteraceae bacterium]